MKCLENSCVSKTEGKKEERYGGRENVAKIYNYSLSLQKQGGKEEREREGERERGREGGCIEVTFHMCPR